MTSTTWPERSIERAMLVRYQASAWFGSSARQDSRCRITSELRDDGIRVVTMDHPPVNALTVQRVVRRRGGTRRRRRATRQVKVVVLRAEGKG